MLSKIELGLLIKQARKLKSQKTKKKYSQRMLAEDIGKTQSYIGDIESGRMYPSLSVFFDIAEACEVGLSFFENKNNE